MSKIQTGQIADGAVTESKATFSDSGGHDHSGASNKGSPVNRGNQALIFLAAGTYNDYSPPELAYADELVIFPTGGDVILTGLDSSKPIKTIGIGNGDITGNNIIIKDNDSGSLSQNRFQNSGVALGDITIRAQDGFKFTFLSIAPAWYAGEAKTNYNQGDSIWARSSDAGAASAAWHRLAVAASRLVGRTASSGLKDLTAAEVRTIINVAEIGFGEIYISTPTQTILAAVPTYTKIAGTTTIGDATGFDMPANNRLRYTGTITRKFKIEAFLTLTITNNDTLYFRIVKNGTTEIAKSEQRQYITAGNTRPVPLAAIVELAQNDYIEIFAARAGAAANATAQKMIVIATPVN